ncbi:uncharacterized protein MONOS_4299 [Monocercomonoides exilis]|uniref:uncharacterized protein n=1 Tax=Monocercomonoides exilis TaxID=2049356 RepID=UPI00355A421C|nr:hypothetical protein MONOS_4299 [Monocercomonoides exilis]|eukprot:MONOS_4299.1-p1 / transcript=MONOS_4299.1 / gene=MONOS_4299 / organism=Monocercomonoides_exilis_PA203 / gene_product=unspecified product / transcript_product=unspecified product / location=Mono_scaffold00112:96097-96348(-) / protein_length=84 / sequence_SO=supercontig / SO=protein_coding / is_pseudo=false
MLISEATTVDVPTPFHMQLSLLLPIPSPVPVIVPIPDRDIESERERGFELSMREWPKEWKERHKVWREGDKENISSSSMVGER